MTAMENDVNTYLKEHSFEFFAAFQRVFLQLTVLSAA
jgi:hypothetical protein